jgi:hypothetical protein
MRYFSCVFLLAFFVFSCQGRKADVGGDMDERKSDELWNAKEDVSPVSDNVGLETDPGDIASAVNLEGDTELENLDDSEFDYFVGKWLMLETDYIDDNLDVNDEEHNSYIEIYEEDGKYRANIKLFAGYEWVYHTGILSKEPAWEIPSYFNDKIYINCDGIIHVLSKKQDYNNPNPLYHNTISLSWDDMESFTYQRTTTIDLLEPRTGAINDNRVRVRAEPNLSSEILGMVDFRDRVVFLKIEKEKQTIDGLESVWYKIRTVRTNIEGWVFGAYITRY